MSFAHSFVDKCCVTFRCRWHCNHKDCGNDVDLCEKCYETVAKDHPHKLERQGFGMSANAEESNLSPAEQKRLSIQRCIQSLVHACQCDPKLNCQDPSCIKMKQVVKHTRECPSRRDPKQQCHICKQLVALCCYHAKHCGDSVCKVPFCASIKERLVRQQQAQQHRARLAQQRRIAVQQAASAPQNGLAPPPGVSGAPGAQLGGQAQPQHAGTPGAAAVGTPTANPALKVAPGSTYPAADDTSERLMMINRNINMCNQYIRAMEVRVCM